MKITFLTLFIIIAFDSYSKSWIDEIDTADKQQQLNLRWTAHEGQIDLRFMYNLLSVYNIDVNPAQQFPNKHWSDNHLIFPVNKKSSLKMQVPYGNFTKITSGELHIDANLSFTHNDTTIIISSLILVPIKVKNKSEIVNFMLVDNNGNKLFTASSIHLEFDVKNKLMKMSNIDLKATKELAQLIKSPNIANQIVAQLHVYNKLEIPTSAKTSLKTIDTISCVNNPTWPPTGQVDVTLLDINDIAYVGDLGANSIIVTPSASLKNIGTADVAWHQKFSPPSEPYNNDQHPYLNWSIYREIDNRFEQIGLSGIKHAFYTINTNCSCEGGHVLGLECEDVYGVGNNDTSTALGPRDELEAYTGIWDNCGSFFDPLPCTGAQQNTSNQPGQNRLVVREEELIDVNNSQLLFQAWYVVRDDIDIFNSMGYRTISPTPNGSGWNMNPGPIFTNGAAINQYVPANTIGSMSYSQSIKSFQGHLTVAVKVIDLGNGFYRYNYAVENYDFDEKLNTFMIPMLNVDILTDKVFSDADNNALNDWEFIQSNGELKIVGSISNQQDWGMLYSFSFTVPAPPIQGKISLLNTTSGLPTDITGKTLVPDLQILEMIFESSFDS